MLRVAQLSGFGSSDTGVFIADAASADGSDKAVRSSQLTGIADGKEGALSCWFKITGNDSAHTILLAITNGGATPYGVLLQRESSSDRFQIQGQNASGTTIMLCQSSTSFDTSTNTGWHHLLISWNLSTPGSFRLYVDDADDADPVITYTDDTLDYTVSQTDVLDDPNFPGAYAPWHGGIFDLWFDTVYLDFDEEAERRRFIDVEGKPVYLGTNGERPTGTQPLLFFHLDDGETPANNWLTNRGSGGVFTPSGTLTVSSDSPTD